MHEKNLGLRNVIATGVGLIVATSCLLSLGLGASSIGVTFIISMAVAGLLNALLAMSVSELNALMPNLTGGLAQYTLACMGPFVTIIVMVGGYVACNTVISSVECAMFGNTMSQVLPQLNIPGSAYCVVLLVLLIIANLNGVDVFAKVQDVVAYGLIISLMLMGVMGCLHIGTGEVIEQPAVLASDFKSVTGLCGVAFFLFIGVEYVVPITDKVKNARVNVPLGMVISLVIIMIMQSLLVIGFKNYTTWEELAASTTPHVLYGAKLLGKFGTIWMAVVSILAVTSSVNTILSSLSYICEGMAKINLLPDIFLKTNKKGAPYVGILLIGGIMILINVTGLSTSESLAFFILTGCVFWMVAYIVTHINVLILRKRLPKAPRTFKAPFTPFLQIVGILGTVWMIWNIDSDPTVRMSIYKLCGIIFIVLMVYAFIWTKAVIKKPMFKAYPVKDVMAMENDLYHEYRKNSKNSVKKGTDKYEYIS